MFIGNIMNKWCLYVILVINLCKIDYGIAMVYLQEEKKPENHIVSSYVSDTLKTIEQEWEWREFSTKNKIMEAAEKGDEKAFDIICGLLELRFMTGIGFTIASSILEGRFVSAKMVDELMMNLDVKNALDEINGGNEVERLIFETVGVEKRWYEVLVDAEKGDEKSFDVIKKILEGNYLVDLPLEIARALKNGLFSNTDMASQLSKNSNVQRELIILE